MILRGKVVALSIALTPLALGACGQSGTKAGNNLNGDTPFATLPSTVRMSLTDKPTDEAQKVNVNVDHAELFISKGGKDARLVVAQNMGFVDLLQLQNGVLKALGDLTLPPDLTINQIRLVLNDGNNLVKKDGSVCQMKTPSAQQSGIKLIFDQPLITESGYAYAIVLDFDVDHSIVIQGNGGCLLKPVIKVKSVTKAPLPKPSPSPSPTPTETSGGTVSASPTPAPTPDTSQQEPVPTSGSSDGSWTDNTSPQDPSVVDPSQTWFM